MQLLLVEDDRRLAASLGHVLEENGYAVDTVMDGVSGLEYAESGIYDVIIMDVMLPKMNGHEVVSGLRRKHISTPILMLTARSTTADKITGLDSGADDYMTKPFSVAELLAHLRALTRRQGEVIFETVSFGDIVLNLESMDLSCKGESIHLRMKEFLVIKILILNAGRIISKDMLMEKVWGIESNVDANSVEAHISFLRKKLKFLESNVSIETVPKVGYKLTERPA